MEAMIGSPDAVVPVTFVRVNPTPLSFIHQEYL